VRASRSARASPASQRERGEAEERPATGGVGRGGRGEAAPRLVGPAERARGVARLGEERRAHGGVRLERGEPVEGGEEPLGPAERALEGDEPAEEGGVVGRERDGGLEVGGRRGGIGEPALGDVGEGEPRRERDGRRARGRVAEGGEDGAVVVRRLRPLPHCLCGARRPRVSLGARVELARLPEPQERVLGVGERPLPERRRLERGARGEGALAAGEVGRAEPVEGAHRPQRLARRGAGAGERRERVGVFRREAERVVEVEAGAGRIGREQELAELGVGPRLRGGVRVVGDEAPARAQERLLVAGPAGEGGERAERRDVVASEGEGGLDRAERIGALRAGEGVRHLGGGEGEERLPAAGRHVREHREGAGGAAVLASGEPHRRLGHERRGEPRSPGEPLRGEIEGLLVEAVLEGEEREQPLGRERVRRRGGPGGEVGVARRPGVAAREVRLRLPEGAGPLVGGEELGRGGGDGRSGGRAAPGEPRDAVRELGAGEAGLAGAGELPATAGEDPAQEGRERLPRHALRPDRLEDGAGEVREGRAGDGRRAEDARRVEDEGDALLAVREEPCGEREGRPAREPPGDLQEPVAQGEPDVLHPEGGEPRPRERRLREGRLERDGELHEVGEPVPELPRALPDVEGERHVGDLQREGLEAQPGGEGLVGEAHVRPTALEAQLETRPAPRGRRRGAGGDRFVAPRHPAGILPVDPGDGESPYCGWRWELAASWATSAGGLR
jgi:hypothetical protein